MNLQEKISPHISFYEVIRSQTATRHGMDNTPDPNHLENIRQLALYVFEPLRTLISDERGERIHPPDRFWSLLEIGIGGYIADRSLEKIVPTASAALTHGKKLADLEYGKKISKPREFKIQPIDIQSSIQDPEFISKRELRRMKRKQCGEERRSRRLGF